MRNSVYPFFTSQLCGSGFGGGNNEIHIPVSDISLNICGSGFFHDHHHHVGSYEPLSREDIPESFNSIHFSDSFMLSETPLRTENDRKRKMKCEEEKTVMEKSKKNRGLLPSQDYSSESGEKKAPVKRSQKISDKITVLQKLVSPFGKTDTASVLQEAHSYIKYLQEQVEMLSAPYFTIRPLHSLGVGSNNKDLSSRGLCLVPVSFTHKLTKDDKLQRRSSQRPSYPRNY